MEATIQGLQQRVLDALSMIDELRQEEIILETRESEILANKDFTYTIDAADAGNQNLKKGST
ncbi:MAG: hypothetical protein U0X75_26960 [Acidobacteriota bacterium]